MKKFWNIFSLLFVSAALFTACFSPITQGKDSGEPGYTKVQIDFSGSGERTIYPNKVFDHYVYMFTVEGGTPQEMTPVDGWFTLETRPDSTAPLKPANWSVAVQAYIGAIDPANLAATGTASFSIMHDDAITVPVTLVSETTGGAGVFMYNITYPQGAEVELFTVEKLPELTESITLSAAAGQTSITETVNNVPAGFYLITVLLKTDDGAGGALYAGKNEVVHIYDKMTSVYGTAQAPITFTADDFSPEVVFERPALTGEVSIEGDAAVGQILTVNTDALNGDGHNNYQWKRGDSAATVSENIGADETYTVSPADLTKYITVSVSRTENSGSVTSEPIGPVTGVQYTVTFDSSGGSDVTSQQVWNGQKLTAPEDPVKTNLIFDAWYKDAAFENVWNFNTDVITGDITLYAKWNSRVILDWNYADDGWLYNDSGINDLPTGPGVTGGDPVHYLNYDKPNAKKFQGITLSSGRNKRVFEDPQHGGIRIGLINAIDSNGVIGGNNTSRLLIGHSDNTDSSATGAWYDSSYGLPELDLSKMVVKVTIGYTYYSFGQDGYGLRLLVNNNSTTSNAGPITNFLSAAPYSSDTSMVGRWADASNDTSHSVSLFTRSGTAATNISQTGKLYAFIDPNKPDLKGNISTLKNAYLCLMGNTGGSTVDKYIIVSSIRIEYVDEVPAGWPSVTYTEEAPVQTYIVSFNANAGTDAVTGMPGQITDLESGASISMP
ncbi:MAG: InlB B-repeat-containing protein, partial [Treponema sp.]|nr:InlB B-repeat-containing protein [Treponema sp.]